MQWFRNITHKFAGQIPVDQIFDQLLAALKYFVPEVQWDVWSRDTYDPPSTNWISPLVLFGGKFAAGDKMHNIDVLITWRYNPVQVTVFDSEIGHHGLSFYCDVRPSGKSKKSIDSSDGLDTPTEVGNFVRNALNKLKGRYQGELV